MYRPLSLDSTDTEENLNNAMILRQVLSAELWLRGVQIVTYLSLSHHVVSLPHISPFAPLCGGVPHSLKTFDLSYSICVSYHIINY